MAKQTIEAMREELEAAGYGMRLQVRGSYISLPFDESADIGAVIIQSYNNDKGGLIRYAYAHLLATRRAAELEAFVQEVAHSMLIGNDHLKAQSALYFKDRAKALLGKQD